jgi:hypothetical protein
LLAASVCDPDAALLRADFGDGVRLIGSEPCSVVGDFNADGVSDRAWVVRTTGAMKTGVRTENPWHLSTAGPVGLAVALSGSPKRLYFLTDSDYFSSPIWSHPEGLVMVRRQGKAHVLLVATESGEDMRVMFDGKAWSVRP